LLVKGSLALAGGVALAPTLGACGSAEGSGEALSLDPDQEVTVGYRYVVPERGKLVREIITSFREAHPNVTVEDQAGTGDFRDLLQQVQADLAAGNPPGVVQVGGDVLRYTANGLPHLNIEEAAGRDGQGEEWLTDNFNREVLELGTVEGVLHFMPYSISNPVLFYNEDALRQAGFDSPPGTWDAMREQALRLMEGTDLLGLSIAEPTDSFVMQGLMESNGAQVLVDNGDGFRCGVDSPEAIEAARLLAAMVLEDRTASFDHRSLRGTENFASGRVAMVLGSNAQLAAIQEAADFSVNAAPFPTFGDKPRRVPAGLTALGIFAEEEAEQAAAWQLIKHLLSPEPLTIWSEGTGYLPPRRDVAEDPQYMGSFYKENPAARAGLEQVSDTVPWVSWPGEKGLEASKELGDAYQRIFTGDQDVADALRQAAQRIDRLIRG
jgi:multiple sugar transport system substrate-binding protein